MFNGNVKQLLHVRLRQAFVIEKFRVVVVTGRT